MELQPLVVTRHIHLSNHDTPAKSVSVDQVKQRYAEADAIVVEEHGKFEKPGDPKDSDPGPMVLHGAEWASWPERVLSDDGSVLATVQPDGTALSFPPHPVPHTLLDPGCKLAARPCRGRRVVPNEPARSRGRWGVRA